MILFCICLYVKYMYLPNPPNEQDATQGQVFKRSLTGLNSVFFLLDRLL